MAVIEMVDKISTAIDNSEYSARVFIDLSKAFDSYMDERRDRDYIRVSREI